MYDLSEDDPHDVQEIQRESQEYCIDYRIERVDAETLKEP